MKYLIIISILLSSCSANWHFNRAIKKDPKIYRNAIVKTHLDSFTVVTEGTKSDTVFKYALSPRDTFIVERDRFRTIVITDTLWNELYIETECFGDTVFIIREVPIEVYNIEVEDLTWWQEKMKGLGSIVFVLILLLALFLIVRSVIKKA